MFNNPKHLDRIRDINARIVVRPAQGSDTEKVINLINTQYDRQKTVDYFYWQFINPVHPARLIVAYDGDILAGFYGVQIHRLSSGETCAFTIDLLIRKEYRNRGLFILLENEAHQFALEHKAVAITTVANQEGMKAYVGLRTWKVIGTIPTLELLTLSSVSPGLEKKGSLRGFIYFSKDKDYRYWRYDSNPEYKYDYLTMPDGAFAVTKIFQDPITHKVFGDIVDFESDWSRLINLQILFTKAIEHLKRQGAELVTTWALLHTSLYSMLKSLGFTESGLVRHFCVKVLKPEYFHLYEFPRWHLVQADAEIY